MKREDVVQKDSHNYELDVYKVGDSGLEKEEYLKVAIKIVRGSKLGEGIEKQNGILTEQLLTVCLEYLNSVNVGDLRNRDTSIAITHIEDALLRLAKRKIDRQSRNVLSTYKK